MIRRLIEEFISPSHSVVLYNRLFNWEISAASFLVKNDKIGRRYGFEFPKFFRFLDEFAAFDRKLPFGVHGFDQGALTVRNVPQNCFAGT